MVSIFRMVIVKMDGIYFSEASIDLRQFTQRYIPKNRFLLITSDKIKEVNVNRICDINLKDWNKL
jgi:hypothetical protein